MPSSVGKSGPTAEVDTEVDTEERSTSKSSDVTNSKTSNISPLSSESSAAAAAVASASVSASIDSQFVQARSHLEKGEFQQALDQYYDIFATLSPSEVASYGSKCANGIARCLIVSTDHGQHLDSDQLVYLRDLLEKFVFLEDQGIFIHNESLVVSCQFLAFIYKLQLNSQATTLSTIEDMADMVVVMNKLESVVRAVNKSNYTSDDRKKLCDKYLADARDVFDALLVNFVEIDNVEELDEAQAREQRYMLFTNLYKSMINQMQLDKQYAEFNAISTEERERLENELKEAVAASNVSDGSGDAEGEESMDTMSNDDGAERPRITPTVGMCVSLEFKERGGGKKRYNGVVCRVVKGVDGSGFNLSVAFVDEEYVERNVSYPKEDDSKLQFVRDTEGNIKTATVPDDWPEWVVDDEEEEEGEEVGGNGMYRNFRCLIDHVYLPILVLTLLFHVLGLDGYSMKDLQARGNADGLSDYTDNDFFRGEAQKVFGDDLDKIIRHALKTQGLDGVAMHDGYVASMGDIRVVFFRQLPSFYQSR